MADLFSSGRLADLILILMAGEAAFFLLYRRAGGGGFLLNLLSGFCLILALRASLSGLWWGWMGIFLAAGGLAHAADVARWWRRRENGRS